MKPDAPLDGKQGTAKRQLVRNCILGLKVMVASWGFWIWCLIF